MKRSILVGMLASAVIAAVALLVGQLDPDNGADRNPSVTAAVVPAVG